MTRSERPTTRAEREALRAVRRVCHSGLDSVTLREEVARRVEAVVPVEARALVATDPDTGLFTHGWVEGLPGRFVRSYMTALYPEEITDFLDLARTGRTASTEHSDTYRDALLEDGLGHRLHAVLCAGGEMWGSWCMFRESASRSFSERETGFLRAVAPHVGQGMRSAAAIEAAAAAPPSAEGVAPGVVVLDARGRIALRSGPAAAHLADLADVGTEADMLPYAVVSLLTRLRARRAGEPAPLSSELRAQGRSGRRYVLRASPAEPDPSGCSATVVVVEPEAPRPTAALLARAYGLTARERDVLLLVVRGESAKRIALVLGISAHTVQDHLGRVCDKVGVRGRKGLVAKLYFDGCVPAAPP